MLVVGEQDPSKLKGHDKSTKHRKAEEAISTGQDIRILGEEGFVAALQLDDQEELVFEERTAEKASREERKSSREREPMHIKIDVLDHVAEDLKAQINELKEARYAADPETRKEDETIDSFADMSLEQLLELDRSVLSDYVFEELIEELKNRSNDDWNN
jgi:hypothetical protein